MSGLLAGWTAKREQAMEDLTIRWKPNLVASVEGLTTHFVLEPEMPLNEVQQLLTQNHVANHIGDWWPHREQRQLDPRVYALMDRLLAN